MSSIQKWSKNDGETLPNGARNRDDFAIVVANVTGGGGGGL